MPPKLPISPQIWRRQRLAPSPPALTSATETLSSTYYHSLLNAVIALSIISILCVLALGFQALYYRRKWLRRIGANPGGKRVTTITFAGESDTSVAGPVDSASVRSVLDRKGPKGPQLPAPQPPIPLQIYSQVPPVQRPIPPAPLLHPPAGRVPERGVRPSRGQPQSAQQPPLPRGPQRPPPSRTPTENPRTPRSRPAVFSAAPSEPSVEGSHLDEDRPAERPRSNPDGPPRTARSNPNGTPPQEQPHPETSRHSQPSRHTKPPSSTHDSQHPHPPPASSPPSSRSYRSCAPTLPSIDTHPGEWPTSQSERSPHDTHSYTYPPTPTHPTLRPSLHPEDLQQGRWPSDPTQQEQEWYPSLPSAQFHGGLDPTRGDWEGAEEEAADTAGTDPRIDISQVQQNLHPGEYSPVHSHSHSRAGGSRSRPGGVSRQSRQTGSGGGSGGGSRSRIGGGSSRGSHL